MGVVCKIRSQQAYMCSPLLGCRLTSHFRPFGGGCRHYRMLIGLGLIVDLRGRGGRSVFGGEKVGEGGADGESILGPLGFYIRVEEPYWVDRTILEASAIRLHLQLVEPKMSSVYSQRWQATGAKLSIGDLWSRASTTVAESNLAWQVAAH